MKNKIVVFLFALILVGFSTRGFSQDLSLGFKAGLSFSSFIDDSELGADGEELEDFSTQTGFHIGILGRYYFYDDILGARFGLIYNQRGGRVNFDGPSYFIFNPEDPVYATGNREEEIRYSNVYLDIPLEAMVVIGGKLEISAGGYVGFLVGSVGNGDMTFSGRSDPNNNPIEPFEVFYDFRPLRDRAGLGSYLETQLVSVDGNLIEAPDEAGAYYEFADKDGNYFNSVDIGLTGGLTYFFNQGLYFNAQVKYGLNQAVREPYYVSKVALDGNREFIPREGERRNFSLMLSMGFAF